jgi:FkbM family methyltransferase
VAFAALKPLVERLPRVAAFYRSVRDALDFADTPVPTPWGFRLAGNIEMAQGHFEPVETELVRNLLPNVDVFVNVGANVGYYCCHALNLGKQVIAFEPVERNVRYLCKNLRANGWNAEVYPIALSNTVAVREIYGGTTGASLVRGWAGIPESYTSLVPCSTMDLVLGERLRGKKALILVDIEGAEPWLLEGAAGILGSSPKPIWVVEIVASSPHLRRTFQFFFAAGYRAFSFDREQRPITADDVSHVASGADRFATHNFLFQP